MRLRVELTGLTLSTSREWVNQGRHDWAGNPEVMEAKLADREYLSVKEFKDRLGVSRNLIYEQVRQGVLPSVRLGGRILIPVDALEQLMQRQEQQESSADPE